MIGEADIRRVQEWMGHADNHTTLRYLHYALRKEDAELVAKAFRTENVSDAGMAGRAEWNWWVPVLIAGRLLMIVALRFARALRRRRDRPAGEQLDRESTRPAGTSGRCWDYASRSDRAATGDVTAPSRMEQSVEVVGGRRNSSSASPLEAEEGFRFAGCTG
jgi:hypothetical protein